jgi:hypothetical protein
MARRSPIRNRGENTHNVVPYVPYDNTSNAYRPEQPRKPETGFGVYLSLAVILFLVIFFWFVFESVVETWERLK